MLATRITSICAGTLVFAFLALGASMSPVADAAMTGDASAVRALIQQKAEVNAAQADGATAIQWAAYRDDLEMADALIAAGANINLANREGATPMYLASQHGSAPMIAKLLQAGADASAFGPGGETRSCWLREPAIWMRSGCCWIITLTSTRRTNNAEPRP